MSWVGWADGDDTDCFATFGPCETLDDLKAEAAADFAKDRWQDGRWNRGVLLAGEVEPYPIGIDTYMVLDEIQDVYSCDVPAADYLFDSVERAAVADLKDRLSEVLSSWMEENGIARPDWVPRIEEYDIEEWEPPC